MKLVYSHLGKAAACCSSEDFYFYFVVCLRRDRASRLARLVSRWVYRFRRHRATFYPFITMMNVMSPT
jgi:hypothetical protein